MPIRYSVNSWPRPAISISQTYFRKFFNWSARANVSLCNTASSAADFCSLVGDWLVSRDVSRISAFSLAAFDVVETVRGGCYQTFCNVQRLGRYLWQKYKGV